MNAHAFANEGVFSAILAEVGLGGEHDIWRNPYGYLTIASVNGSAQKKIR